MGHISAFRIDIMGQISTGPWAVVENNSVSGRKVEGEED